MQSYPREILQEIGKWDRKLDTPYTYHPIRSQGVILLGVSVLHIVFDESKFYPLWHRNCKICCQAQFQLASWLEKVSVSLRKLLWRLKPIMEIDWRFPKPKTETHWWFLSSIYLVWYIQLISLFWGEGWRKLNFYAQCSGRWYLSHCKSNQYMHNIFYHPIFFKATIITKWNRDSFNVFWHNWH